MSEGGRTSRIVGFSPPVSVGLVMEPNLLPYQSKVPLPNPFSQIAALPPWLPEGHSPQTDCWTALTKLS